MNRIINLAMVVAFCLGVTTQAGDKKEVVKHAGFEKLSKLVGSWVAVGKDGKPTEQIVSVFKLTGGGSAIHETIFPGAAHEMVSVYHLDGKDLVMTHYCAAKNQPRMKAEAMKGNKLEFKFIGGANIDPAKDFHMHEGWIAFVDDNTIEWNWQGWANGKPAGDHAVAMKLVRKK